MEFKEVKDSGAREEFSTGSVRDTSENKGDFSLLSPIALRQLALHYQHGAKKYKKHNWILGQPLSRYLDSAMRHLVACLECDKSENHPIACAWNCFAFVHTVWLIEKGEVSKELDDIGWLEGRSKNVYPTNKTK